MSSLGSRIAYLRNKKGMSQGDFSKVLKIGKSTLGMYETDKREPSNEITKKIAAYFDVTIDWLLTGKSAMEDTRDPVDKLIDYLDMEFTNEEIRERVNFKVDNISLTDDEVESFIAFVRAKRSMKMQSAGASGPE